MDKDNGNEVIALAEVDEVRAERIMEVYRLLMQAYGPRHWWPAKTPFEMMVGAILTQNTTWANVEKAIANLGEKLSRNILRRCRWRSLVY